MKKVRLADSTKVVVSTVARASVGYGLLFTVVGFLASRKWSAPQTTWAALASMATVTAAVVGVWTLVSVRRDSRDRTRPMMIAEIRPGVLADVGELIVRNVGPTSARNVSFTFAPELPESDDGALAPYFRRRYSRTFPTIGPGMQFHDVYQTNKPTEPVPDDFTLTINYSDTYDRQYTDSYELSVSVLRDSTRATPGGDTEAQLTRRLTQAVEAIARGVGRR